MKQRFCMVFLFMVLWCVPGIPGVLAQMKPTELKYATFGPDFHPQSVMAINWCKEIEKRTSGKVKITFYGGQTLLKAPAIYDGVLTGVADIGMTITAYTRGRFPLLAGLDLPLGYPTALVSTKVANDVYRKFRPKEMSDTHFLYFHALGPYVVQSKKPVRVLGDLKGMKIRGSGDVGEVAKALGATPVGGAMSETYDALAKGVVDGTIAPFESLTGWKLAEVIEYVTDSRCIGFTTVMWVGMNLAKWNSLPKDVQQVFTDVSAEWAEKHARLWDQMDAQGRDLAVKLKREIIELPAQEQTKWIAAVQPLIKTYIAETEAKGLPGKELVDYARGRIAFYSKSK
jgi:TRAP-type C4-dicarboxylate transport system substrate-binding protein